MKILNNIDMMSMRVDDTWNTIHSTFGPTELFSGPYATIYQELFGMLYINVRGEIKDTLSAELYWTKFD